MKSNGYYSLPLKAKNLVAGRLHDTCTINQSIAHHIHLINTSYFGECTFDENFGCNIWIIDFDNLNSSNKLKSFILNALEDSLKRLEKRLTNLRVDVKVKQEEIFGAEEANRIKKKININVKGKIKKTNETFNYVEYFFIGPLSY